MARIAVVYHSGYGHTARLAHTISEAAVASLHPINKDGNLSETDWAVLQAADVIIMGSPTYMGSVTWQFKKFADATSKHWITQAWKDKLFAGFTNSATMNGDKLATLYYLFTFAMQHGGLWIGAGLLPSNTLAATRNDLNYVGAFAGLMATTPSDAAPAQMFPGDLETARVFALRIALIAKRFS
jgi:multimeric flavodoxin WrbA